MFYIYVKDLLIVKKIFACYIPINASVVYLSRAVFAFTAMTHSSPQDFSTVHWKERKKAIKTRLQIVYLKKIKIGCISAIYYDLK